MLVVVGVGAVGEDCVAWVVFVGKGFEVFVGGFEEFVESVAEVVGGGVAAVFPCCEGAGVHVPYGG